MRIDARNHDPGGDPDGPAAPLPPGRPLDLQVGQAWDPEPTDTLLPPSCFYLLITEPVPQKEWLIDDAGVPAWTMRVTAPVVLLRPGLPEVVLSADAPVSDLEPLARLVGAVVDHLKISRLGLRVGLEGGVALLVEFPQEVTPRHVRPRRPPFRPWTLFAWRGEMSLWVVPHSERNVPASGRRRPRPAPPTDAPSELTTNGAPPTPFWDAVGRIVSWPWPFP